jgi:hypothetical protein
MRSKNKILVNKKRQIMQVKFNMFQLKFQIKHHKLKPIRMKLLKFRRIKLNKLKIQI